MTKKLGKTSTGGNTLKNQVKKRLVHFLRMKRKEFGLNQKRFAKIFGMNWDVYRKYEEGVRNLPIDKFVKIMEAIQNYEKCIYGKNVNYVNTFLEDIKKECLTQTFCKEQSDMVNMIFDDIKRKAEQ